MVDFRRPPSRTSSDNCRHLHNSAKKASATIMPASAAAHNERDCAVRKCAGLQFETFSCVEGSCQISHETCTVCGGPSVLTPWGAANSRSVNTSPLGASRFSLLSRQHLIELLIDCRDHSNKGTQKSPPKTEYRIYTE